MNRFRRTTSRWLLAFSGVAAATALVACQSSASQGATPVTTAPAPSTTTGGPPATAPTRSVQAGPARCHTADLGVSLGQQDSATGHTGLNIALTNRSPRPCRLYGYGGVQLLDAAGHWLPTQQLRAPQPAPRLITLAPGASAYSGLYWAINPDAGPCVRSTFLLVTPPDETESIRTAFAQRVCSQGRIQQTSYQPAPI
jgi:Protein of unknown function (DUF4232)